jgi:hypothetical protein
MKHKMFSASFDIIVFNLLIIVNIFHRILGRESDVKMSLKKVITDVTEICRNILDKMSVHLVCCFVIIVLIYSEQLRGKSLDQ